jgi:hypothetical protein
MHYEVIGLHKLSLSKTLQKVVVGLDTPYIALILSIANSPTIQQFTAQT